MLTSIHLHSWKAHRDTTVPLGKLTLLVGPNGSGKTTVLEAPLRPLEARGHSLDDKERKTYRRAE